MMARPQEPKAGEGLGIGDPEGVVIRRLGLFHLEVISGIGGGGLGVHHHLISKQHVFGGEGGAILPLDPVAQVKGNSEPVRRDVPALGQVAHQVEIAVIFYQAVIDQADNAGRGRVHGQGRQQGAGVADGAINEEVTIGRTGIRAAIALFFFLFGFAAG